MKGLFVSHPGRAVFLVGVIVVALAAGVYAYLASLPLQQGPRVSITSPPVEFSLELDKTEYQYGENISIRLCLKNVGNKTITLRKSSRWPIWPNDPRFPPIFTEASKAAPEPAVIGYFHFGFSITHQNGTEIFKEYSGVLPMGYEFTVEPGGYVKQTWIWWNPLPTVPYHIPKGTHQIRGIPYCGISGLGSVRLETPSITFIYN